jgi:hypothetical protein
MAKKISQETFDDVVRENVEDFEQELAEAIADATSQFQKQGVDLSNIDLSGGVGRQEMLDAIAALDANIKDKAPAGALTTTLTALRALCSKEKTGELSTRNKNLMREKGLNNLHLLMEPAQDDAVLVLTFVFIEDFSNDNGECMSDTLWLSYNIFCT